VARRGQIDQERHDDAYHGPERPRAAEPVLDGWVPEERRGQKDEAEDGPQQRGEEAVKPVAEEPEEGDGKSRHKEREGSEQAGQWILPDRR